MCVERQPTILLSVRVHLCHLRIHKNAILFVFVACAFNRAWPGLYVYFFFPYIVVGRKIFCVLCLFLSIYTRFFFPHSTLNNMKEGTANKAWKIHIVRHANHLLINIRTYQHHTVFFSLCLRDFLRFLIFFSSLLLLRI